MFPWFTNLRRVAATLTMLSVILTSYVAVGGPVPATMFQVDGRLAPIQASIVGLKTLIISNSRDQLDTRKGILRSERLVIEQTLTTRLDIASRQTFNVRLGQISDELEHIEHRRNELDKLNDELKR